MSPVPRGENDTLRVIDVHAHAVLAETLGAAGDAGPELSADPDQPWYRVGGYVLHGVRYRDSPFMDPDLRIARMDEVGIDLQMLSPNPLTYFGDLAVHDAVTYCRKHNDALATVVGDHRDRLCGAAQLPLQDVDAAVAELRRAVSDLGLVSAAIDTDPLRALDDPAMDPFYETLVELDVPLFLHPSPLGPEGPPADRRLRRFDLDLLVGFAYDETLAVSTLILGGVLDRHPGLDVCVSHGGGATALLAGRLASAARRRPWAAPDLADGGFERQLRRLWFDTHVHSDRALACLIDAVGTDHLVFGTNFAGWDGAEAPEPGKLADALSRNATRLLRL
ncbi:MULTISPECIES: amidohydrolase family protein [Mumia]|uniref:amidohydrolase family protein n=1 Tax=Mumia TaxID=1546255 RepID=UPI00142071C6|nr:MULTISPECIES: amidohydrolase family protein [unclassified Mumia]QMW65828.1 amidohydrolase [Mumia sp. ZJ1417]